MNLIDKVKAAIERDGLIPEGATVMAGVSGGADSVALLHSLHRLGYSPVAVHLNHAIRGAEADGDEAFVKTLCAELSVQCVTHKTDVPALAREKGISLEMAAREARHDFFRSVISDFRPQSPVFCPPSSVLSLPSSVLSPPSSVLRPRSSVLCLAHHADDQLETFFLRAARGTGSSGLGGMRASHELAGMRIVRPMLGIRRFELIQWLEENGLVWREDASNADEAIPRNIVRHQILPVLGRLNQRAAENILRTMEILRDEETCPEKAARRREVRDWLIAQGVTPDFDRIEKVIQFSAEKNGTRFLELEGLRLVNEYGVLKAVEAPALHFSITMEAGTGILRGPWCASVSLARIAGREVTVRTARPGDRMEPYGMDGSKKLQDIFTELKIPKTQRAIWPVVECGGEVIWVPGYRIARGWELASDSEPALHLRCSAAQDL